ncbi:putative phosphotransferase (phosphomutase) [Helianthus annuus]|uniref:phosphoglucomutase (alpha-D-glucose-1,6-bisphosphate-dependent) n=1 Tax=Helianthus annuus TaxID=4232 RepID=A0A251RU41_HELAN|nr:phosphomannomutase/phosphoglucomutase [Helianthus annuus]KAF5778628.1 putative phosphotransferase (phosphomutase) [Helianthus annuus]KAJ0494058.1 putative phosphotransferase (phosphomutase) [Helianthus annuus]KAJ0678863.1 putative phosphotransferase (phosphomutase) [Helianthus annuus]KAJ0863377.1 putative phosphotransferase (phosphomutase) [Helianthus annuus]
MSSTLSPSTSLNNNTPINHNFPSSPKPRTLLKTLNFPFSIPSKLTLISPKSSTTTNYNELGLDEEMGQIKRLQNGSDVRGVAVEGEPGRKVNLTPPAVEAIAESFGEWVRDGLVKEKGRPSEDVRVSLGRDPRISGGSLSVAIFSGLGRAGCITYDMGLATTPACFMSTVLPLFSYDASIMMTASHLPYTRNGLKFFTKKGGLTSSEVEEICNKAALKYANRLTKVSTLLKTTPTRVDFMSVYAKHLRDIIKERVNHPHHYDTPLEGFQIIVNAGNGSGGFFTFDVLDKLGADTFGSLNLTPDGMFPNHIPNPEDEVAMSVTRTAVLETSADLGIVFDTDVDRSGVVDKNGNPINGDKLIALMAAIVLKEHPGSTIVTDARTSLALTRFITDRGGHHCLYRVGYRNVIDKGVQLNEDGVDAHLMMETSGHGALKENYFLDDGAYMVVKIIIEMVRMKLEGSNEGIGSLIKDLEEPLESVVLRMDILSEPKHAKAQAVEIIETFKTYVQEGRLAGWELDACGDCWVSDGCLVDSNDTPAPVDAQMYRAKVSNNENGQYGWLHIRQSIHNPNIAVNMQSSVLGGCLSMAQVFLDKFLIPSGMDKDLDFSQINKYAKNGSMS